MFCPKCGKKVKEGWKFCSYCGAKLEPRRERRVFSPFKSMFERFFSEFEDFDDFFSKDFEVFDATPWFESPRGSGFSISITQSGDKEPKVDIKTFGDVDKEKIEREVEKKFGIKPKKKIVEVGKERRALPKIMEEPKTEIKRLQDRIVVEMNLPGVESEADVELNELSESVEVKAFGKDKAYFKILKMPEGFRLMNKQMKGHKLILEFSL